MQAAVPLSAETLVCVAGGFMDFRLVREMESVKVRGRYYTIIEGSTKDTLLGGPESRLYCVVTPEKSTQRWRLALLLSVDEGRHHHSDVLFDQTTTPTFSTKPPKYVGAAVGLTCNEHCDVIVRAVLVPYQLPVTVGKSVDSRVVEEVGVPVFGYDNESAIVPVRFRGGKYGIFFCRGRNITPFIIRSEEARRELNALTPSRETAYAISDEEAKGLIANSSKMPVVRRDVRDDIWHIFVGAGENDVLIISC